MISINKDNFEKEVVQSNTHVIMDFWASWCGPCKMMAPVFEDLSSSYAGKLKFVKVDTEENPELAARYSIQGIPSLVIVNKGAEVERIVGFTPKDALKQRIDQVLSKI